MTLQESAAHRSRRVPRQRAAGVASGVRTALVLAIVVLLFPALAAAQTKRAPRPSPTPDPALAQIESVQISIAELKRELAALREDMSAVSGRLDAISSAIGAVKGIAEPMREEVRGLYVESSNVRAEISRLEETYAANTESLAKSRYVLTLLLVATAVLQVVVLAVLLRSR